MHKHKKISQMFSKALNTSTLVALLVTTLYFPNNSGQVLAQAVAGVTVTGVSDNTIANGQSITILGSGFGTKLAVSGIAGPPVLWDNFEDGANGQLVQSSSAKWDRVRSDNTSGPRYYAGAIDSSMGVRTGSGIVNGVTAGNTRSLIEDDEFRNLYLDYYIRAYKGEGLKQRSNKQIMIWSANAGISEDGPNTAFWQITQGGEEPPFAFSEYSCANEPFSITYANGWGVDEFTTARHVQIEYRRPSATGVDNGHLRIWYDGVLVSEDASFGSYACDPERNYLDNLYIGHYQDVDSAIEPQWKWISCPGDSRCDQCPAGASGCSVNNDAWLPARQDEFFYDNIYIDKSIARVELGNAPSYAASTRREIQVPTSWGNSIQIKVNKGAFSSGQTAYLYVVNADGSINSSGYPVTIDDLSTPFLDTVAPTAPSSLSASVLSSQVNLSWNASSDNVAVTQYVVERSTSASSGFAQIGTTSANAYTNYSLTGPTTYYYRVRAQDASNNYSTYSNTVSATIQAPVADTTAPTTPTNLSATVSGNQASLSWSASTDSVGVTGYQILRSTTNGSGYTLVSTSNTTSYTDSSLPVATYYYVVKAYDAAGNTSTNSNQATAQITTSNTSCTPITITNLTSSIGTSNPQNTASVTATSGSVMYLTVGLSFMPVSFPSDSINISGLGATWTKVSTNTFGYRRRVWLFKGVGGSGTGPVTINYNGINTTSLQEVGWVLDKVTGLDLTTPNDSVTTVETAGVSPSSLTISTSQTPGTCDVTYSSLVLENQKTTNVESGWSSLGQTSTGSLGVRKVASAWDDARDTSHTWSWTDGSYAAAFMTILNSGVNVVPPTGDATAPSIPSNLMANATSTLINLSWSASTDNVGVSQYLVERSNSANTGFTQLAVVNINSYVDIGLPASATYYYRVRARDVAGNFSAYSTIASATTPVSVVNDPTSNFSPWCSSLLGIVGSAVKSGVYSRVADINNDQKVNLSDLTAATNYYTANNDGACQARFINTYTNNNYLNIDWCSGILKGLQDRYSLVGSTAYSSIFDLNNDDAINLADISLISEYTANNNQATCFAEYNLPLSTSQKPVQTITKLPSLTTNTVDANLVKKLNITKTEQSKLNLLKGRFATLSDGASAYINTKGQAIALDDATLMQTLAKQALGISKATLAKLQVSLNYNDSDNDGDQVPNIIEELIGTDLNNKDTDGDGYTDGVEIENWYSPTKNTPKARLDKNLAKRLSGRILIAMPTGALFYVNPNTYKLELLKNATLEQLNSLGVIKEVKGIKIRK